MRYVRKAITAAGFGLVAALGSALLDGHLTLAELLTAIGLALTAGGATYAIPNARAGRAGGRPPASPRRGHHRAQRIVGK